jgi:hypothetical protein
MANFALSKRRRRSAALAEKFVVQVDQRAIGQLADDFMQHDGRDGGGTCAFHHGGGAVDHFDIQIGGAEADLRAIGFDQDVGKDRDGVAAFHDGLGLCQCLEQRAAFDREFHLYHPMLLPRSGIRKLAVLGRFTSGLPPSPAAFCG